MNWMGIMLLVAGLTESGEPLTEQLQWAVQDRDVERVEALLLNETATLGEPQDLVSRGLSNARILELLLSKGFDPNALEPGYRRHAWRTISQSPDALGVAFQHGCVFPKEVSFLLGLSDASMKRLFEQGIRVPGADFDFQKNDEWFEEGYGYTHFVVDLLDSGNGPLRALIETGQWKPDMRVESNCGLLHLLAAGRYDNYIMNYSTRTVELMTMLLKEHGLDPNLQDDDGDTPLLIMRRAIAELQWGLRYVPLESPGFEQAMKCLMDMGARTDLKARDGMTPELLLKVAQNDPAAVDTFLQARAKSAEALQELRNSILRTATEREELEVMQKMVDVGANPDEAFHYALAWGENEEVLAKMIDIFEAAEAQLPEAPNLHRYHVRMIKFPVVAEAWVRMGGQMEMDPWLFTDVIYKPRSEELLRLLVKLGVPVPGPETRFDPDDFASYDDWVKRVVLTSPGALRFLIRDGYLPAEYQTPEGQTLLHLLAQGDPRSNHIRYDYGDRDVPMADLVPFLIEECGIDPNAKDQEGNTALHLLGRAGVGIRLKEDWHSARELWHGMREALLKNGARLDLKNQNGITPADLHAAAEGDKEAWEKVEPLMAEWGILPII